MTSIDVSEGSRHRRWARKIDRPHAIYFALGLLVVVCLALEPSTLNPTALRSMLPFAAILAMATVGQALVVGQAGFDFSVAGMIATGAVITTEFARGQDGRTFQALILSLAVLLVAGFLNGISVTLLGVTPLVATLAMNAILLGLVIRIGNSVPVRAPSGLTDLASGRVLGIPNLVLVAAGVVAVVGAIVQKTAAGRRLLFVGTSRRAAVAAGVRATQYVILAYTGAALCYWFAAIALTGYVDNPSVTSGDSYILTTITAVVLAGASLSGGRVFLVRSAAAALFLTQLGQLITALGASAGAQFMVQGAVIGVAVLLGSPALSRFLGRVKSRTAPILSRSAIV